MNKNQDRSKVQANKSHENLPLRIRQVMTSSDVKVPIFGGEMEVWWHIGVWISSFWSYLIILLMVQKSGEPVDIWVVYPTIYRVLYIPGGAGFLP